METCSCLRAGTCVATRPEHKDFTTVIAAKRVTVKELEKYKNPNLTITDRERDLGYKYVYQTQHTKTTTGERIRAPMGMFSDEETFIDNDAAKLLNSLSAYYN